jgi:hypothetical protein
MRISLTLVIVAASLATASCGGSKETGNGFVPSNGELRREYKKSPLAFTKKYDGKDIEVWGTAEFVDLTGERGSVKFKETEVDLSGSPTINCIVEKSDFGSFTSQKAAPGMMIRVTGKMQLDPAWMNLKSCRLVKTGAAAASN